MTQEKARELLTGLAQTAHGRKTCAYEIADRLMSLIRNPHSGQFTGAMQLGKGVVVVPIRTGLGWRLGVNVNYLKFTQQATWNPL
jgi:Envelope integrity protein A